MQQQENKNFVSETTNQRDSKRVRYFAIILTILVLIFIVVVLIMNSFYTKEVARRDLKNSELKEKMANSGLEESPSKDSLPITKKNMNGVINGEKVIKIDNVAFGQMSFKYPLDWEAFYRTYPPEGMGVVASQIQFVEKGSKKINISGNISLKNDFSMDIECLPGEHFSAKELVSMNCPEMSEPSHKKIKIDGQMADLWEDLPGLATANTEICMELSDKCILHIVREQDMFAEQIIDQEFKYILDSIEFDLKNN